MRGTVFRVSCQQRGNIQNTVVKGLRGVGDAGNKRCNNYATACTRAAVISAPSTTCVMAAVATGSNITIFLYCLFV